jgi:hypothetical protein
MLGRQNSLILAAVFQAHDVSLVKRERERMREVLRVAIYPILLRLAKSIDRLPVCIYLVLNVPVLHCCSPCCAKQVVWSQPASLIYL